MPHQLDGKTIAILATDGFEQVELTEPKRALEEAGATVHVIAPEGRQDPRLGPDRLGRGGRGRPGARPGAARGL